MKFKNISLFNSIIKELNLHTSIDIENGIFMYCISKYGYNTKINTDSEFYIINILQQYDFPTDLENIIEFFEFLLEKENKTKNGIVFTPKYITKYIVENVFEHMFFYNKQTSIIDPSCGCGSFLITAVEYLTKKFNKSVKFIIEHNIYGIDINPDNVRRCTIIFKLLCAKHGELFNNLKLNIICKDSLKINWSQEFGVSNFDYIIGNPPYANPHDMEETTSNFLKNNFATTKNGTFNIYYAFIEKSVLFLKKDGIIGYIVPNNFLTIKAAFALREFLKNSRILKKIINLGNNMVFKPIRTYNCIIFLENKISQKIEYCYIPKSKDVQHALSNSSFYTIPINNLNNNSWRLIDERTYNNIKKIESQLISIKNFVRTGIATLKDEVYFVNHDKLGFYKLVDKEKMYIENDLIKVIYKIPELKLYNNTEQAKKYIIFPYKKINSEYRLIKESDLIALYPKTYTYLLSQRKELDKRDKGKGTATEWYAYGRSQGLNKYGKKLLFPTFSKKANFTYIDNEDTLFCNGYAVFENDIYELDVLQKILNSKLMEYYIENTSYSIEGGYYCYQKKYIENFSIPWLTNKDIEFIRSASDEDLNNYLWALYNLE